MASAIWSWMEASKSSEGSLRPAVSIKIKDSSILATTLSRVVPSSRATMAMFLRAKRLSRLDLPALVWPIRATIGSFIRIIIPEQGGVDKRDGDKSQVAIFNEQLRKA